MSAPTSPATRGIPARRRRDVRGRTRKSIPLLLMLVGMLVLLYPVLATQYNNIKQREFAAEYNQQVQTVTPDTLAEERRSAAAYNQTLSGVPILDPYLTDVAQSPGSEAYNEYLQRLGRFDAMARVRVPNAKIDLPVYHGTSDDVITKGAGHLYGTSLPVGGPSTHSVLTSHRGMSNATLFDNLVDVQEGDLILLETFGQTLAYEVDSIKVVLPTEIDDLHVVEGADMLTLFTCTPYAVNTHRLLVTGHRVPFEAEVAPAASSPLESAVDFEPWMLALMGGAFLACVLIVVIMWRENRSRRRVSPRHAAASRFPARALDPQDAP